ncbi:Serine/threonine-protein kinase RUNKEL [Arabidopsis thaliana]
MTGRRHGPVSPLNSRASVKTNAHLFPVVLHLLGSSLFKNKMVTPQVLRQLANLTKLVEASFQLKVARRIGNLFEFVNAKDMEDFLEPTLSLCRAFLLRSLGNKKGLSSNYTKEPMLLSETSFTFEVDPQECIRDIADFGSNIGLFLHFAGLDDDTSIAVADIASECVVLLLKAASREATTGFLTNLPKITQILDSWRRRKSTELHLLVLKRVLHCLGYACKQYLSQAMILSISGHDISKINAIVSEMKNSDVAGLNSVASLVAMELQRLPRCV